MIFENLHNNCHHAVMGAMALVSPRMLVKEHGQRLDACMPVLAEI